MSLLESYNKNKKKHLVDDDNKHLLNEVSVAAGAETHAGRAGDHIDRKFAGPFHPEFAQLKKLLKKQVEGDIIKRMYTDDNTPVAERDFFDINWTYEYDKEVKKDNSKFKNTSETEMQSIPIEYHSDDDIDENEKLMNIYLNKDDEDKWKTIIKYDYKKEIEFKSKFKNTSGDMENVDIGIKYDKIIDKTEENKKYINDTNNWKSIYDSKK